MVKIIFASCNRQNLPQDYWKIIEDEQADYFLWTGDAVYTKGSTIPDLRQAYDLQLSHREYQSLVSHMKKVDGVWDDHDYGVNDAGADVSFRHERQLEFLRFLERSGNTEVSKMKDQDGIYHSLDVPLGDSSSAKVVFLDTRTFRSPHYIRSLGEYKFPLSAIFASAIRGAYSVMGYGREYDGEILGEVQWKWLEETLANNKADLVILVSSIQMLTSNPVFEGWGHFPKERLRLLNLLKKYNTDKILLVSGDVHLAELSSATFHETTAPDSQLVEITSSGLTHSSADNFINKVLCPLMMTLFNKHRITPTSYFVEKNYAVMSINPLDNGALNVSVALKSLNEGHQGEGLLSHQVVINQQAEWQRTTSSSTDVTFADYPVLPPGLQLAVYCIILTAIAVVIKLARKILGLRTQRALKKKKMY
eukprot:gene9868-10913_t